jgi:hypothetical protein
MDPTLFPVDYLDQERKALGEHVSSANISAVRSAAPPVPFGQQQAA